MNVLVYSSLFPSCVWPTRGVFVWERMRYVAGRSGIQLRVVSPVPYYPSIGGGWRTAFARMPRVEQVGGFEVHHPRYLMTPKIGMVLYGVSMGICSIPCVRSVGRTFPVDVLDAHFAYPDGVAGALISRVFKVPLVLTVRGSDINVSARFRTITPWVRWALRTASHVIAVSGALGERVRHLGVPEEKLSVIPNGVDPGKFFMVERSEARHRLALPLHRPILLSVGTMSESKGMPLLIEAVKQYRAQAVRSGRTPAAESDPMLYLLGDGPDRTRLDERLRREGLGPWVKLVGSVPHEELVWWYNAADLFCLASEREGCPNVVKESLACGTPVLASPVGGIPEILDSPSLGRLVPRSAGAFADAIQEALRQEWDRRAISLTGRRYTWEQVGERVRDVFSVVRNGGSRAKASAMTMGIVGKS